MKATDIVIPGIDTYMTIREVNVWIDDWRILKYGSNSPSRYFDENGKPYEGEELADEFATIERVRYLLLRLCDINRKLRSKGLNYYLNINERESLKNEREIVYNELERLCNIESSEQTNISETTAQKFNLEIILGDIDVARLLQKAISLDYIQVNDNNTLTWKGYDDKASRAQLAYVCGLAYGYKYNEKSGHNEGGHINYSLLERMFNVSRLDSAIREVYNANKPQKWRVTYDKNLK